MFSFKVVEKIIGSCSTQAISPFFMIFPLQYGISSKIAEKRDDFPDPTFPIIPQNFLSSKQKFIFLRVGQISQLYGFFQQPQKSMILICPFFPWVLKLVAESSSAQSLKFLAFMMLTNRSMMIDKLKRTLTANENCFRLIFKTKTICRTTKIEADEKESCFQKENIAKKQSNDAKYTVNQLFAKSTLFTAFNFIKFPTQSSLIFWMIQLNASSHPYILMVLIPSNSQVQILILLSFDSLTST